MGHSLDRSRPTNYSLGEKATFGNTAIGNWVASKTKNRPLEVIGKSNEIRIWDWEPNKLIADVQMTSEEFDDNDFYHIVVRGK